PSSDLGWEGKVQAPPVAGPAGPAKPAQVSFAAALVAGSASSGVVSGRGPQMPAPGPIVPQEGEQVPPQSLPPAASQSVPPAPVEVSGPAPAPLSQPATDQGEVSFVTPAAQGVRPDAGPAVVSASQPAPDSDAPVADHGGHAVQLSFAAAGVVAWQM